MSQPPAYEESDTIKPAPLRPSECPHCHLDGHYLPDCQIPQLTADHGPSGLRRMAQYYEIVGVFPSKDPGPLFEPVAEMGKAWFYGFIDDMIRGQETIRKAIEEGGNTVMEIRAGSADRFATGEFTPMLQVELERFRREKREKAKIALGAQADWRLRIAAIYGGFAVLCWYMLR